MSDFYRVLKSSYGLSGLTLDEAALAAINRYTLRSYAAEELFAFKATACDNEVDRDLEAFDTAALEQLARMLPGKSVIMDHENRADNQQARVYAARVELAEGKTTGYGQPYARLEICAYMPRGEHTQKQIEMIEAGIRKEVSIGCRVQRETCSICGENYWSTECEHQRGHDYEGHVCFVRLHDPSDAYEVSFVAVPAQPAAGVVKHRAEEATAQFCTELHEIGGMIKRVAALLTAKQEAGELPEKQAAALVVSI